MKLGFLVGPVLMAAVLAAGCAGQQAGDTAAPANRARGGPGFLGGGHQIATDSKGNIYVAATARGLQKLAFKGLKSGADQETGGKR